MIPKDPPRTRQPPPRLIISESESGADMLYATRFRAPDPFVFLEYRGRTSILLNDLELDRGRREAQVDEVVSSTDLERILREKTGKTPSSLDVIATFLKDRKALLPRVAGDFPLGLALELKQRGIVVKPVERMLFPEREIKTPDEVRLMTRATRITESGMKRAFEILLASRIGSRGVLTWGGTTLTAERLRMEVEGTMLREGGIPAGNSIVACGEQACDPHERGHGPLKANQLLILDLFPRAAASRYYGDLTRTVVKGKATEAQWRLWETCLSGQQMALSELKPGASGDAIHEQVKQYFTGQGYPTQRLNNRWSGFFHGTGHGLGLDLHESPRFGAGRLKAGQVFTIEPGIYIPGLGGVRHEDVVLITERGHRQISRLAKPFEI